MSQRSTNASRCTEKKCLALACVSLRAASVLDLLGLQSRLSEMQSVLLAATRRLTNEGFLVCACLCESVMECRGKWPDPTRCKSKL